MNPDVVIVGGGIAGGSLATVAARAGVRVLLLERRAEYRDQIRGEILWPWGVGVAQRLGIEPVLLAAGAKIVPFLDVYDEGLVGPQREEVGAVVAGVGGSLNIAHPTACAALAAAAAAAGADVRRGVGDVRVRPGSMPSVAWVAEDGAAGEIECGLVVGADGRRSAVRAQAAVPFEVDEPAHLVAGILAEGIDGIDDEVNVIARESDLYFLSFPQGESRARVYLCFPTAQRSRFASRDGAERFLEACGLGCLEGVVSFASARPAGPCGTFAGEDSRARVPVADGVALIGDAAGYENPLQGQGLSMALQDVEDLMAALAGDGSLQPYVEGRATRQRLANLGVALEVWVNDGFAVQEPKRRLARYEQVQSDEVLSALEQCYLTGFDTLPEDLTRGEFDTRLLALA